MRYHTRTPKVNWEPTLEVIIGFLVWASVCAVFWWAVFTALEAYTN